MTLCGQRALEISRHTHTRTHWVLACDTYDFEDNNLFIYHFISSTVHDI